MVRLVSSQLISGVPRGQVEGEEFQTSIPVGENYCSIQQLSSSRSAAGWINSSQEPNLISSERTRSPQQDRPRSRSSLKGEEQTCWSVNNQPENSLQKAAAHASFPFTSAHTFKLCLNFITILLHFSPEMRFYRRPNGRCFSRIGNQSGSDELSKLTD